MDLNRDGPQSKPCSTVFSESGEINCYSITAIGTAECALNGVFCYLIWVGSQKRASVFHRNKRKKKAKNKRIAFFDGLITVNLKLTVCYYLTVTLHLFS